MGQCTGLRYLSHGQAAKIQSSLNIITKLARAFAACLDEHWVKMKAQNKY